MVRWLLSARTFILLELAADERVGCAAVVLVSHEVLNQRVKESILWAFSQRSFEIRLAVELRGLLLLLTRDSGAGSVELLSVSFLAGLWLSVRLDSLWELKHLGLASWKSLALVELLDYTLEFDLGKLVVDGLCPIDVGLGF